MHDHSEPRDDGEITALFRRIDAARDEDACHDLWALYFGRVLAVARRHAKKLSSRDTTEEDVALSAMKSFFRAAEQGAFDRVDDRNDLWRLLAEITRRKAHQHNRRHLAKRRGAGAVVALTDASPGNPTTSSPSDLALEPLSDEGFVGQMLLELNERLDSLPDPLLRGIVLMRLEGHELSEIAAHFGTARATICRKLSVVRELWMSGPVS